MAEAFPLWWQTASAYNCLPCLPLARYMLGRGEDALYVCFMGTKELRDYLADLNLIVTQLWAAGSTAQGTGAVGLVG